MQKSHILIILTAALLALTACNSGTATPSADTADIPLVVDDFAIIAEGRLVPADSVRLSFVTGGQVAEVLVEEGALVEAGQVLARLGDREPFEAAVAGSQYEVAASELETVAAQADLLSAQQNLEAIHDNWPQAATAAQQALNDARQRQYDADRFLEILIGTADQTDIDLAYTAMILAEDALENAQEDYEPYANKPADNLVRAALQAKLAQAQQAYDTAVRNYNALLDDANEFDVSQAEAELAIANAQLAQAQEDYDELIAGPDPDAIALAEAVIAASEARVRASAQRVLTAQANLAAAEANLGNLELTATIAGTIVEIDLIVGENVAPGAIVIQIADFSRWFVETDNLTEIEVVDVALGQKVTIVPDALPDVTLTGQVDDISDVFEEKRGDITYTTSIVLDEIDPRLRWGMTVVVTFEK